MKQNMLISIIVPVYNVHNYIRKCLTSVANQQCEESLECIIVDDCGSDDSIVIASEFIATYSGPIVFRIIKHEKNKGLSAARNTGVKNAHGEYVFFLDSDDYLMDGCIITFLSVIKTYDHPNFVVGGAYATMGFLSYRLAERNDLPNYTKDSCYTKWLLLKPGKLPITAWNKLISKSFFEKNDLFFEEGMIHEDEYWNAKIANVLSEIAINKNNTYCYNIRENSITTNLSVEKSFQSRMITWNFILRTMSNHLLNFQIRCLWRAIAGCMYSRDCTKVVEEKCKDYFRELHKRASFFTRLWMSCNEFFEFGKKNNLVKKILLLLDSCINSRFFVSFCKL